MKICSVNESIIIFLLRFHGIYYLKFLVTFQAKILPREDFCFGYAPLIRGGLEGFYLGVLERNAVVLFPTAENFPAQDYDEDYEDGYQYPLHYARRQEGVASQNHAGR